MKQKKSQATMEFILAYGWALLIILFSIGVLVYFGVFNIDKFIPNKCSLSSVSCFNIKANSSGISFILKNKREQNMTDVIIKIAGCGSKTVIGTINSGSSTHQNISCPLTPGTRFTNDIIMYYKINEKSFNQTGSFITTIK